MAVIANSSCSSSLLDIPKRQSELPRGDAVFGDLKDRILGTQAVTCPPLIDADTANEEIAFGEGDLIVVHSPDESLILDGNAYRVLTIIKPPLVAIFEREGDDAEGGGSFVADNLFVFDNRGHEGRYIFLGDDFGQTACGGAHLEPVKAIALQRPYNFRQRLAHLNITEKLQNRFVHNDAVLFDLDPDIAVFQNRDPLRTAPTQPLDRLDQ
jgi:hypothetical protein